MSQIRLLHLADIHLGFTGPTSLMLEASEQSNTAGRYVREVDIENAVASIVKAAVREQPPIDIVVIAGDLFHRSTPYPRAISRAARLVRRLVEHGVGVVIIDGNHEMTNVLHTGSPTTFLKELGAYVINGKEYKVLRDCWSYLPGDKQERLADLAIHVLPYRAVAEGDFLSVRPLPGYINVLVSHGRVAGMSDLNSLHRTAATLPTELLRRGWDYVALGDWHMHRHQPLQDVPAFYSGSLEALNFGEATFYPPRKSDAYALHGGLDVRLEADKPAIVQTFAPYKARPVLRLEPIDASDLSAPYLMQLLRQRLKAGLPSDALVRLEVQNCPAQTWEQLPFSELAELRKQVLLCNVRPDLCWPVLTPSDEPASDTKLDSQWQSFIEQREPDAQMQVWYYNEGMQRIEAARTALLAKQADKGE